MRPQPQDLPEVTHLKPVPDSRGLALAGPDGLAWTGGRHAQPSPHYAAPEAPTTLRPCYFCGEPAPPVPGPRQDYGMCGFPLDFGRGGSVVEACLKRAGDKRDEDEARRSADVAAAAVEGAARAREEDAPEAPATGGEAPAEAVEPAPVAAKTTRRARPSQARKAALEKPAPAQ